MNDAIGLIETKGVLALVNATDAMAKAADVTVVKRIQIGGGFVTTIVRGASQERISSIARSWKASRRISG